MFIQQTDFDLISEIITVILTNKRENLEAQSPKITPMAGEAGKSEVTVVIGDTKWNTMIF